MNAFHKRLRATWPHLPGLVLTYHIESRREYNAAKRLRRARRAKA